MLESIESCLLACTVELALSDSKAAQVTWRCDVTFEALKSSTVRWSKLVPNSTWFFEVHERWFWSWHLPSTWRVRRQKTHISCSILSGQGKKKSTPACFVWDRSELQNTYSSLQSSRNTNRIAWWKTPPQSTAQRYTLIPTRGNVEKPPSVAGFT